MQNETHKIMIKRLVKTIVFILFMTLPTYWFGIIVGKNKDKRILKNHTYYKFMCKWASLDREGVVNYFLTEGLNSIAVYGAADMGQLLYNQLNNTGIEVKYFIGYRTGPGYKGVRQFAIGDTLPEVDAIVVTPFLDFAEIESRLQGNSSTKVISIEEVIENASK